MEYSCMFANFNSWKSKKKKKIVLAKIIKAPKMYIKNPNPNPKIFQEGIFK